MKITILCENQVSHDGARSCLAEWGFSAFIEINGFNILLDTGHTGIYTHNAAALNIDLQQTDCVVLSHYHWDHTGGLQHHNFKTKKRCLLHPSILNKLPSDEVDTLQSDFDLITSKKVFEITEGVYFLGEIPRVTGFEQGVYKEEPMEDDSAIVVRSKQGAIVITGCSHSGICNICEYAKKITGQELYCVIGGFHLFEHDQRAVKGTIEYFKNENVPHLYPMHCIDFPTLAKFHTIFGVEKLSTGDHIVLDD